MTPVEGAEPEPPEKSGEQGPTAPRRAAETTETDAADESDRGDEPARKRPSRLLRCATAAVCGIAGFMITVSSMASSGKDLRPNRSTDLVELVQTQSAHNKQLATTLSGLRQQVDEMSAKRSDKAQELQPQLDKAMADAALTPVQGPAVQVSLSDAPLDIKPIGVAGDLLVVHQQDIQAVANALWSGGAEAMTIQGVRVTSTTGIKCVGNSVVLRGVPYAPPYVITAIGSQEKMQAALSESKQVQIYKQYVTAYSLGYSQKRIDSVEMPGFEGSTDLKYAKPGR